MNKMYDQLNLKQKEAVFSNFGPIRIIAGAGSGKTKVLTSRFHYLVHELNMDPRNILAITFTNKASEEMRKRIYSYSSDTTKLNIFTYHGLCLRILREDIDKLDYNKDFYILDDDDKKQIIRRIMNTLNKENIQFTQADILEFLNLHKSMNHTVEDLKEEEEIDNNLLAIYDNFLKIQVENKCLDFNDLLFFVRNLFKTHPEVREKWQNRFKYILIDEFQDTNDVQYEIVRYLLGRNDNIFVVGDPDQSIYGWRGANIDLITKNISRDFPNVKTIILDENYRSTKTILNISNNLIAHNKNRIAKNLVTNNDEGKKPTYYKAFSSEDEANWISSRISELLNDEKVEPNNICVLYRNKFQTRNIEQTLMSKGINYKIFGSFKFFERKEIKDVVCYLRSITYFDDLSILRIINVPTRKIGDTTIEKIIQFAKEKGQTVYDALSNNLNELNVSPLIKTNIRNFINLLKTENEKVNNDSILNIFNSLLNKSGYSSFLKQEDSLVDTNRLDNIEEFKNYITTFEKNNTDHSMQNFLQELSLFSSTDEDNPKDCVFLMTIHTVKGLEFDHVFVLGFNQGYFPSYKSLSNETYIEEERRIAYVAMTRARKRLSISSASGFSFVTRQELQESQFLHEINKNLYEYYVKKPKTISDIDLDFYDSKKNMKASFFHEEDQITRFSPSEKVSHIIYGEGIIIALENDMLVIAFSKPHGIKKILANHKSIKRIL